MTTDLASAVTALLDDLAAEEAALDDVVEDLDEPRWRTPTQAPGWDVRDQIIHLAFVEELARQAADDPPAFAITAAVAARDPLGFERTNLERGRLRTGADVLAWWRAQRTAALDALRRRAVAHPGSRLDWFGPPMSLRSFATARLMETWAHGWEVAQALDRPLPATARLHHVAHLGVTTRAWSFIVRGERPDPTPVRVELEAPNDGDSWRWGPEDATQRVTGSALDFCLVVTQRRRWDETTLQADGDAAARWLSVAQAFAGPPTTRATTERPTTTEGTMR